MTLTENQQLYCMYVIGTVESNCNWASVNYNDPITLGMMQWYGSRARGLLDKYRAEAPEAWAWLEETVPTLCQQVIANTISWESRYMTAVEGNAFINATRQWPQTHVAQQKLFLEDLAGYMSQFDAFGFPENNVKERFFFASMWHQSPLSAQQCLQSCSATASLNLLRSTVLNHPVLGKYVNRYNTVYDLLSQWDGSSAPPDFGQIGGVGGDGSIGDNEGGNEKPVIPDGGTKKSKMWIQASGRNLLLMSDNDAPKLFAYSTAGRWVYSAKHGVSVDNSDQANPDKPNIPSGAAEKQRKVWDLYHSWIGRFDYSQGAGRLDPLHTGYGDCSSTIWRAYQDALAIDVGTWTGAMVGKGTRVAVSGVDSIQTALNRAQKADLILFNWVGNNPSYQHVEMYSGDGDTMCGHGGPGRGPTDKSASQNMANAAGWEIRRYIS